MSDVKCCPHCGQTMMIYRRNIRVNMLRMLRILYFKYGFDWKMVNDIDERMLMQADFPKLRFWGLIEAGENTTWRITPSGVQFILGHKQVLKYVWVYNNTQQNAPIDSINPLIWAWDVKPQEISKEIVLADAIQYPYKQESGQFNFL